MHRLGRRHLEVKGGFGIGKATQLRDCTLRRETALAGGGRGGGAESRRRRGGVRLGKRMGCGKWRERGIGIVESRKVRKWSNWGKKVLLWNGVRLF